MLDALLNLWQALSNSVRIADILDVVIVAAILYAFITWLRASASRSLIIATFSFAALYVLARLFRLYLTEFLIQAFLVLIVITAIVVFQSDIRRMFARLATWTWFRESRRSKDTSRTIEILVETAQKLAKRKTGALIAIHGREPWEHLVHGGVDLDGRVSQTLLLSLFNKQAPGHDGAILLKGDRIVKFAAHLTLSTNRNAIGDGGTRHAAALGLAEQCDAFVLVVSEERGTISIAESETIQVMDSVGEIKERLQNFWQKHYSAGSQTSSVLLRRLHLKTLALSFSAAILAWYLFSFETDTVYRTFVVPIEFQNLPQSLELEDPVPYESRVTLSGSEQAFRLLDPSSLMVSVDLSDSETGTESINLGDRNLELPSNIDIYRVDPRTLRLKIREEDSGNEGEG